MNPAIYYSSYVRRIDFGRCVIQYHLLFLVLNLTKLEPLQPNLAKVKRLQWIKSNWRHEIFITMRNEANCRSCLLRTLNTEAANKPILLRRRLRSIGLRWSYLYIKNEAMPYEEYTTFQNHSGSSKLQWVSGESEITSWKHHPRRTHPLQWLSWKLLQNSHLSPNLQARTGPTKVLSSAMTTSMNEP